MDPAATKMVVEPSKLGTRLLQLKEDSLLTDVVIVCNDAEIHTHKCVLSAGSLFFKLLFTGSSSTVEMSAVNLTEFIKDSDLLKSVIDFLYVGSVAVTAENVVNLTAVAEYLAVSDLIDVCSKFIEQVLSHDNCLQLYLNIQRSNVVTLEDVKAFQNREMFHSVWSMVESRFYDHVLQQEEILQVDTEAMLGLMSRGIVKHFSPRLVLHFLVRWLGERPSDGEVVEVFLSQIIERIQITLPDRASFEPEVTEAKDLLGTVETRVSQSDIRTALKRNITNKISTLKELLASPETATNLDSNGAEDLKTEIVIDNVPVVGEKDNDDDGEKMESDSVANSSQDCLSVGETGKVLNEREEAVNDGVDKGMTAVEETEVESEVLEQAVDLSKSSSLSGNSKTGDNEGKDVDEVLRDSAAEIVENVDKGHDGEACQKSVDKESECVALGEGTVIPDEDTDKGKASPDDESDKEVEMSDEADKNGPDQNVPETEDADIVCLDSDKESNDVKGVKRPENSDTEDEKLLEVQPACSEEGIQNRVKACLRKQRSRPWLRKIYSSRPAQEIKLRMLPKRKASQEVTVPKKKKRKSATPRKLKITAEVSEKSNENHAESDSEEKVFLQNLYLTEKKDTRGKSTGSSIKQQKSPVRKVKKVNRCNICDKIFKSSSSLKLHMDSHAGVKNHRCMVCGMLFGRGYHLIRHMRRKHSVEDSFKCDICEQICTDPKEMVAHSRTHINTFCPKQSNSSGDTSAAVADDVVKDTVKLELNCDICDETFAQESLLKAHLKEHSNQPPYQCVSCQAEFESASLLQSHVSSTHQGLSYNYKCKSCKRTFNLLENYERHVKTCQKGYKCDQCGATFYRQYHLDRHQHTHSDDKPFPCDLCKKAYKTPQKLREHCRREHESSQEARAAVCELCGLVLKDVRYLRRHLDTHKGLKAHQCQVCFKSYTQASGLQVHMRIHTGSKPFQCEICSMLFSVKSNLMRHQRRHRGDRRYKCDQCGKGFVMMSDLKRHYTMHTGEKNYSCKFCGKRFSSKCKVAQHERIHTGERPYECRVCGKRFTQNGDRKRHENTHGPNAPAPFKPRLSLYEIANGSVELEPSSSAQLDPEEEVGGADGQEEGAEPGHAQPEIHHRGPDTALALVTESAEILTRYSFENGSFY